MRKRELRSFFVKALGGLMLLSAVAFGQTATVTVSGQANPFLAGMPSGSQCCTGDSAPAQSPAQVTPANFTLAPGSTLTFTVTGSINDLPGTATFPPDGSNLFITPGLATNGIANFKVPEYSLIGVFLDDTQPDSTGAPATLDYSQLGINLSSYSPLLKQVFFIGDGLTGNGTGSRQTFTVPAGATRLFLAATDTSSWYNNTGSFSVTVTQGTQGSITPTTLPNGNVNTAYVQQQPFQCVTGCSLAAPNWTVSSGTLPPGLNLTPGTSGTASLTGTPTQSGLFTFTIAANSGTFQQYQVSIGGGPISITTTSLPNAFWGVPYSFVIQASGGTPPYNFVFAPTDFQIPSWLHLNAATGELSGTPPASPVNALNPIYLQVNVTDSARGSVNSGLLTLNIVVQPLSVTTLTLPAAVAGQNYSQTVAVAGGVPPYTFSMPAGLVNGLTINSLTGEISGRPLTGGIFNLQVNVNDTQSAAAGRLFSLQVLDILTNSLPNGVVGTAYSASLRALGTKTPVWGLDASSVLPDGLSLSTAGVITGTPTKGGVFNFNVTLTDGGVTVTQPLTLTIAGTVSITTTSLPIGTVSKAYSAPLQVSGGTSPYTWQISQGSLPAGLTINQTTGVITGTPTAPSGTASFTVTVTDSLKQSGSQALTIKIIDVPAPIVITTTTLPGGVVKVPYLATLAATGATSAITWSVTVGTLPAGLTLNTSTGAISGSPTTAGTSNFTIGASYDPGTGALSTTAALSITVVAPPAVSLNGLPSSIGPGQQPAGTVALSATYPLAVNGSLTLTFNSINNTDNPEVRFTNSSRTINFTIPAGSTAASFGSASSAAVITGTVAGTITITQTAQDSNGVTLQAGPPITITVTPTVPVISSVKITQVTGGFNIVITGFSTPRNMTSAAIHFTATSGNAINPTDVTVQLTNAFTAWYSSQASLAIGSQFSLTIPFTTSGGSAFPIAAVSVTLTNSVGTSNPATANP